MKAKSGDADLEALISERKRKKDLTSCRKRCVAIVKSLRRKRLEN